MRSVPAFLVVVVFSVILDGPTAVAHDGIDPHWIWVSADRSAGQAVTLRKTFRVPGQAVKARLDLAADFTRCHVKLNGETLTELDEYGPWLELDVTEQLKPGENTFELKCVSGAGPAAVAITLGVMQSDATSRYVVSDTKWQARIDSADGTSWRPATSLGVVAGELWGIGQIARVSSFDDYEQWRQATGAEKGTDPATFLTQPGFEVELVRSAKSDESSWVSMAFDPQGRVTIGREDKGLLRVTLSGDGLGVEQVEMINDTLLETRGLLYAHDMLYASANNSKALYRLRDTTGDDQFDEVKVLREFPGGVGHGRNDLALGPDGLIYAIRGDSVELPTENIFDRTSPFRAARRGQRTTEGHLLRCDKDGQNWELVAAGLRNPFGIDFNADGEIFTYDADAEFDMGSPWYRPTRIDQLVSGADFGWRGRTKEWPPYFMDHADNSLPVVDVGKGSPTAVKSGLRSAFPQRYRRAMFALDWTYGRILACHLSPRGAGYACRVETFLKGRPLNVTDLDFGPDGSMYVVIGGRKTQSALYRVRYTGPLASAVPVLPTRQSATRQQFSAQARELNRQLARHHGKESANAITIAWPQLGNPDPVVRHAARVAVEHQPVISWSQRALTEPNPEIAVTALLALARSGQRTLFGELLGRLNDLDTDTLSAYARLTLVHVYRLCLQTPDDLDSAVTKASRSRLLTWLNGVSPNVTAPTGTGDGVRRELGRLVADLHINGAVEPLTELLGSSSTQRERMHALFVLRDQKSGWSPDSRRLYFEALRELERTAFSGQGMPGFLRQIREQATAHLTDSDREQLAELLKPAAVDSAEPLLISRPLVQKWTLPELTERLGQATQSGDAKRGQSLFRDVRCVACHRLNGRGGVIGPDLTAVSRRFSRRDILASIIDPSLVIAEKYRGAQVVTTDGKVINGRVVTGGDYRAIELRIVEDSMQPGKITRIKKQDIELTQPSKTSPMPAGLVDTLTAAEILDLLAFMASGNAELSAR
jgi:putative heme-binding domain-containing protein